MHVFGAIGPADRPEARVDEGTQRCGWRDLGGPRVHEVGSRDKAHTALPNELEVLEVDVIAAVLDAVTSLEAGSP